MNDRRVSSAPVFVSETGEIIGYRILNFVITVQTEQSSDYSGNIVNTKEKAHNKNLTNAVVELQEQAAVAGANAIIILTCKQVSDVPSGTAKNRKRILTEQFTGQAVFVTAAR